MIIIIPARFSSTRLPGKPLLDIAGKPMIQRVHECAARSGARRIVVATDDVQGVHSRARALGSHIHAAPYEWSFVDPAGVKKDMRACSLFDLDGYFYEVNETVPPFRS